MQAAGLRGWVSISNVFEAGGGQVAPAAGLRDAGGQACSCCLLHHKAVVILGSEGELKEGLRPEALEGGCWE